MSLPDIYAALQASVCGQGDAAAIVLVREGGELTPQARLAIYREGYGIRLRAAVADDYACLAYALGRERFEALLGDYIASVPSVSFNLDRYATGFGAFAASRLDDRFEIEVALIEAAIADVYLRAETRALSPADLLQAATDTLADTPFTLRESCVLMATEFPADDFLRAFREGNAPARPQAQRQYLAVVRHAHTVRRLALDHAEYRLLQTLAQGSAFGAACDAVARELNFSEDALAAAMPGWMTKWLENGFFGAS